jgi:hypothetical protein
MAAAIFESLYTQGAAIKLQMKCRVRNVTEHSDPSEANSRPCGEKYHAFYATGTFNCMLTELQQRQLVWDGWITSHSHITCTIHFSLVLLPILCNKNELSSTKNITCLTSGQHVPPISASLTCNSITMWWTLQMMQDLIMQFSHAASTPYFKYAPHHIVLRRLILRLHCESSLHTVIGLVCVSLLMLQTKCHAHTTNGRFQVLMSSKLHVPC